MLTFVFPTLLAFFAVALLLVISLARAVPHLSLFLPRSLSPLLALRYRLHPPPSLCHKLYRFSGFKLQP